MNRILVLIAIVMLAVSCHEEPQPMTISGIGSIEVNDSATAIHYFEYTLLTDFDTSVLPDSARAQFKVALEDKTDETTYRAKVITLSDNLRRELINVDANMTADSIFGTAPLTPSDIRMTRDFRRLDFFNITVYYTTRPDNDDFICLTYDPAEQTSDTIALWLRHYQAISDSCTHIEYRTISVAVNSLASDTMPRRYIDVRHIDTSLDTVTTRYVYSY